MSTDKLIDHLFRHQHGKMVSILVRFLGLSNIDLVEDIVQDTFYKAMMTWRKGTIPEAPEAWLMRVAKNRAIDLLRKGKVHSKALEKTKGISAAIAINEIFLEEEIADAQLRMIFTACHPILKVEDQLTFALKTISGFNNKEIAVALLSNVERIKKSIYRARQKIKSDGVKFEVPSKNEHLARLSHVHQVIYLIFNEGFHSHKKEQLVRKDLCMEAMRLCKLLTDHHSIGNHDSHALMALMCFHSGRLESKVSSNNELVLLREQDRSKWYFPLIQMGNRYMNYAVDAQELSKYHWEAAIAAEHVKAMSFEQTDWHRIVELYDELLVVAPSDMGLLNKVAVLIQLKNFQLAQEILDSIDQKILGPRVYLFHAIQAEKFYQSGDVENALQTLQVAMDLAQNSSETEMLKKKRLRWSI